MLLLHLPVLVIVIDTTMIAKSRRRLTHVDGYTTTVIPHHDFLGNQSEGDSGGEQHESRGRLQSTEEACMAGGTVDRSIVNCWGTVV